MLRKLLTAGFVLVTAPVLGQGYKPGGQVQIGTTPGTALDGSNAALVNSALQPYKAENHAVLTVTASGSFDNTLHTIIAAGSFGANGAVGDMTAAFNWQLPACTAALGSSTSSRTYAAKKVDKSTFALNLVAATTNSQTGVADTIDGLSVLPINNAVSGTATYPAVVIQCDGLGHWWRGVN